MSDKQAYIASLESQIEKNSNSNILISTFSDRIEQLQKQLNTAEERISNLTRLFKLQSTETLENSSGGQFIKLEERVSALENTQKIKSNSYKSFSESVDSALRETEKRIAKLIEEFEEKCKKNNNGVFSFGGNEFFESISKEKLNEKEKIIREAAENAWLAQQTCNKLAEDTIDRVGGCEKRIRELKVLIETSNNGLNIEDIEMKVTARLDESIENLSSLIKGYIKSQELLAAEIREFKEKHLESRDKDPGVFSFGSTSPKPFDIEIKEHHKVKSEVNSRENSKEKELRGTRKRSSSPAAKIPVEKKATLKKDQIKTKRKNERKNKLEKLYQNFSEKNT